MKMFLVALLNISMVYASELQQERAALLKECQFVKENAAQLYQDMIHPEAAIESAIKAYLLKVIEREAKRIAEEEAHKILQELKPSWLYKEK